MWSGLPQSQEQAAPVGAGKRAGFYVSSFAGVSQTQLGSPPRKKKKFSLVTPPGITVRNSLPALARSRIQLRPGEPGKPAPRAPGGAGRGRRRRGAAARRRARPALRTAADPAGAGRTSAALGRHLRLHAVPRAGRRGYCLESACRALRPRRRPGPEPRGRAG